MGLLFGGTDNLLSSFEESKAAIVPVPYEKTVTYKKGTENGPLAILEASDKLELFDEELKKEPYKVGISTLKALRVRGLKPEDMVLRVEAKVSDILTKRKKPIVIGGEHSVSVGAVKAAKKHYKDLSILYFDAHYDLKDSYNGSKYNHACVARRLAETADLVEAGVRSISKEEFDFLKSPKSGNIKIISMSDIIKSPDWHIAAKASLSENIYISVDLDVFDPSIMPSVGTPEPGGMGWHDFLTAVENIIKGKNIVGFDVVELSPLKGLIAPDFMAAKLIYKMIGYMFS